MSRYTCNKIFVDDNGPQTCGAPLDEIIESIPEDGNPHAYECPKCGAPHAAIRTPPKKEAADA